MIATHARARGALLGRLVDRLERAQVAMLDAHTAIALVDVRGTGRERVR